MRKLLLFGFVFFLCSAEAFAQQWQSFTMDNSGLPSNNTFAIDVDVFGNLWIGTDSGMAAYEGLVWYTYSKSDSLADNQVNDFEILRDTEIWVTTNNGVSAIGASSLDVITMATPYRVNNTGLLSNKVNSIAIDPAHNRWFATDSGVTAFTGSDWISTKTQRVVLKNDVMAIDISPDTIVYCGTEGGGVARLKLSALDVVTGASTIERPWTPLPIDSVYAIYIGQDSVQWFGTPQGLFQHIGIDSKINWKMFTTENGLPDRFVQTISEDSTGKMWIGTMNGVSCIEKDLSSFINYSTSDGLINNNVRDIVIDAEGVIWFATAGGVSKFSPNASPVATDDVIGIPQTIEVAIYPNPFNMSTSIEFKINHYGFVNLSIYNLSGQCVRSLWNKPAEAGAHVAQWDGCDDNGNVISSGVYMARLITGEQIITKKMLVIK